MTVSERLCLALFGLTPAPPVAMLSLCAAGGHWWEFGFTCPLFVVAVAASVAATYHLGRKVAYTDAYGDRP